MPAEELRQRHPRRLECLDGGLEIACLKETWRFTTFAIENGQWTNMAIENGPVEIVDEPINSMVIFHSYVNVYQRVWEKGSVLLQVRLPNHTLLGQLGLASFWPPTRKNSSKFHLRLAGSIELDAEQGMCESLTPDLPPKKFKQLCRFSQKSHGCLECFKWLWVKIKSCW